MVYDSDPNSAKNKLCSLYTFKVGSQKIFFDPDLNKKLSYRRETALHPV